MRVVIVAPAQNSPWRLATEVSFFVAAVLDPARDPVELLLVLEPKTEEALAETPYCNGLPEPFKPLLNPFRAGLLGPVEPLTIDPSCNGLVAPSAVATAAACVTVTVY